MGILFGTEVVLLKKLWPKLLAGAGAALVLSLGAAFAVGGRGTPVPVLMYHHFIEEGPAQADTVVTARSFEEQLQALKKAGYTSITPRQLTDYVDGKGALPEKPVLITMDDGYTSNLTIAAPILEKYGMTATVFVIGINVGEKVSPHSGQPLDPPRFSWGEVRPWVDKGVLTVQSHTYDMHQRADYGFSGRDGVLPLEGETDYRAALVEDFYRAKEGLEQGMGTEMTALAFPFGLCSREAVDELEKLGVRVTFTTEYGCSRAVPGAPESIQCMDRWNITDEITGEQLTAGLQKLEIRACARLF